MIKFKKVRFKNFFTFGNSFTEISLDNKERTVLITGKNGAGKSTMLDSLCFVLYGKPYRNINKPQVINSINNKNCVVEIEFEIGRKKYKIIRGLKPNIFEIWCDNNLLNQDSASRDYQAFLEDNILKMNYKSFTQIVILGSANFVPFMQLTPAQRREIIEDLLDIKIFTSMKQVLKEKVASTKANLQLVDNQIELIKKKGEVQSQYINQLKNDKANRLQELVDKKASLTQKVKDLKAEIDVIDEKRANLVSLTQELAFSQDDLNAARVRLNTLVKEKEALGKRIDFYEKNSVCPKCEQGIHDEFKHKVLGESHQTQEDLERQIQEAETTKLTLEQSESRMKQINSQINIYEKEIASKETTIYSLNSQIQTIKEDYDKIESRIGVIDEEIEKLKALKQEAIDQFTRRGELVEEQHYYDIAETMLKDTGIKTRVIKQYLPAINTLINKYLTVMDFYVMFNLDEKFDEVIKSRHRDNFSYESFSEGQKQRIDLALLFTWRQISKLKKSADTNLLILDEVFDSSLDDEGTQHVMSLLKEIGKDTNVFVISHKGDKLKDNFKKFLNFELQKDFSHLVET